MNGAFIGISVGHKVKKNLRGLSVQGSADIPPYRVTLVYLGKNNNILPEQRASIVKAVADVCTGFAPLRARVGGFGKFVPDENTSEFNVHAVVDCVGLSSLRDAIHMAVNGVFSTVDDYGFVPHITLGVSNKDVEVPSGSKSKYWDVPYVNVQFADVKIRCPLLGGAVEKSEYAPVLQPLFKSRAKGSTNKNHMYLLRLVMADGTYRYVRPDDKDVESYNPKLGFILKHGKTIKQVIDEKLFGSYGVVRKTNKKSGISTDEEFVVPGLLYDYQARRTTPAYLKKYGVPVSEETVGKVRFYKYKRIAGWVGMDLAPGVNYVMPKKGTDLQLVTAQQVDEAKELMQPAQPGKVPLSDSEFDSQVIDLPSNPSTSDANPAGVFNIHAIASQTEKTNKVLSQPLPDNIDPLNYESDVKSGKVEALPQYAIDKFGGDQQLLDEIQRRPATTLVTLGKYAPTQKKVQDALYQEWRGVIRGLSMRAFDAFKVSNYYNTLKIADTSAGRSEQSENSLARKYRNDRLNDLNQEGAVLLLNAAQGYIASKNPDDRFDTWAYSQIENGLYDKSRKDIAETGGSFEPIASDADADALTHKYGAGLTQIELSPEEMADLSRTQREAKKILTKQLMSEKFPETYRKVFLARLWLDKPASAATEQSKIEHREEIGQAPVQSFERPFTGPDGIASVYPKLQDPKSGKIIDMTKLSAQAQTYYLGKWYEDAKSMLIRQFSVPGKTTDESDEAGDKRVLTTSGQALKRWLELKTALLAGNKRIVAERTQHPVVPLSLTSDGGGKASHITSLETAHPAMGFWSNHTELADKLGLGVSGINETYTTPNISLGTHANHVLGAAEKQHRRLLDMGSMSDAELRKRAERVRAKTRAIAKLGVTLGDKGPVWSGKGVLSEFHDAIREHQKMHRNLSEKVAAGKTALSDLKRRAHLVQMNSNPFHKKKDPDAYAAHEHLVNASVGTHGQLDEALATHLHEAYDFKNKKAYEKTFNAYRQHLEKNRSFTPEITEADKAKILEKHSITDAEKSGLEEVKKKAAALGSELSKLKVDGIGVGANVVNAYLEAASDPKRQIDAFDLTTHQNALSNALRDTVNEGHLLAFEQNRRKGIQKSGNAYDLCKSFHTWDYVCGQVFKQSATALVLV